MRLDTKVNEKIQDFDINLEPRQNYQLTDEQKKDPAFTAGDPDVKPEGMTGEQKQNQFQKAKIDPYFKNAKEQISYEKKFGQTRFQNQGIMTLQALLDDVEVPDRRC